MTTLPTRDLYQIFLTCDWWRKLSLCKRKSAGRCERCGATAELQSHHKVYRPNWFDTVLGDLEVLCRSCHEKEHGIQSAASPLVGNGLRKRQPGDLRFESFDHLRALRAKGKISRQEFLEGKEQIGRKGRRSKKAYLANWRQGFRRKKRKSESRLMREALRRYNRYA